MTEDLRFPLGTYKLRVLTAEERCRAIDDIARAPAQLRSAVEGLSDGQLDTPYRPGGWTVRQVVHHLPDSHLNSYTRFKLALTEDEPTIKPYDENLWANLEDGRTAPVDISLALFETLHRRFVLVLKSLGPEEYTRTFRHPEIGVVTLEQSLGLYAWHGRHHVAHITSLRERMGWA